MVKQREGLTPQNISDISVTKMKMLFSLGWRGRRVMGRRGPGLFQRPFKGLGGPGGTCRLCHICEEREVV